MNFVISPGSSWALLTRLGDDADRLDLVRPKGKGPCLVLRFNLMNRPFDKIGFHGLDRPGQFDLHLCFPAEGFIETEDQAPVVIPCFFFQGRKNDILRPDLDKGLARRQCPGMGHGNSWQKRIVEFVSAPEGLGFLPIAAMRIERII